MLMRSTSLPIDGWIAPSRKFPDKSLHKYHKRQPLTTQKKSSIELHPAHYSHSRPGALCSGICSKNHHEWFPSKEYPSTGISATLLKNGFASTAESDTVSIITPAVCLLFPRHLLSTQALSTPPTMRGGRRGALTAW